MRVSFGPPFKGEFFEASHVTIEVSTDGDFKRSVEVTTEGVSQSIEAICRTNLDEYDLPPDVKLRQPNGRRCSSGGIPLLELGQVGNRARRCPCQSDATQGVARPRNIVHVQGVANED